MTIKIITQLAGEKVLKWLLDLWIKSIKNFNFSS